MKVDNLKKLINDLESTGNLDRNFVSPGPNSSGFYDLPVELDMLYRTLRGRSPTTELRYSQEHLQGQPRPSANDPNPARADHRPLGLNGRGLSKVSPDHIIPLVELIQLPGFLKLSPENMLRVINSPVNLQWLPTGVNQGMAHDGALRVANPDMAWVFKQLTLRGTTRLKVLEQIEMLNQLQQAATP
ncbi:hypothetical protein [Geodermatophilus amargosae]|uniref:hypothetical protein n=1 Tax=Geodermatophilus amargosae TaxID=1296565 RepID=UPI0011147758|nr:hypothetical protein [Geodermatophilus amargosae]